MAFKKKTTTDNVLQTYYLEHISEYVRFSKEIMKPLSYDKENQEYDIKCYTNAIEHIITYLRNAFSSETLQSGNVLEIDVNKMCEGIDNAVIYSIYKPKFRDLIYIISEEKYPHFHTNGNVVVEAEGIHTMLGLNPNLRKIKINGMFEGLDLIEARDLLKQMQILPKGNNLEKEINFYEQSGIIHRDFILSVVYNLLMSGDQDDVIRARLFADSFGIKFNFTPYEEKDAKDSHKLCMGMKEST